MLFLRHRTELKRTVSCYDRMKSKQHLVSECLSRRWTGSSGGGPRPRRFGKSMRGSVVPAPGPSVSVRGHAGRGSGGVLTVSFTLVSGRSTASISNRYSDRSSGKAAESFPHQDRHSAHQSRLERKTLHSCTNQAPCPKLSAGINPYGKLTLSWLL